MPLVKKKFRLGIKGQLSVGGSVMGNVTNVTITLDAGEADVTTRDNQGFRATVAGLKECSIEFDMLYLPGDAGFTTIRNAWLKAESIEMKALTSEKGEGPHGWFSITGFSRSEALEEAIKYSVTAKLSQWEAWIEGTGEGEETTP